MEKNMEHEMETGSRQGYIGFRGSPVRANYDKYPRPTNREMKNASMRADCLP